MNTPRALQALARHWSWPHALGFALCGGGALWLLYALTAQLGLRHAHLAPALIGGAMAAAATALGTVPVLLSHKFSQRSYDCFLGFGAGVMLAATAFSLVLPALAAARQRVATPMHASLLVAFAMGLGMLLIVVLNLVVRERVQGAAPAASSLKRVWIFVLAVTLHNLPEGLAIGVGYAGVALERANALAAGIAIQDVPEGLVVALALRSVGYGRRWSVAMGAASGLVEPVMALAGLALIGLSSALLPWGLAAAAGAMLFVIVHDAIPEAQRSGNGGFASVALVFGFLLMMVLDTALS
ncbi:Zinc transporter ZupT [Janthinobacterium sp. KBS0711]|uniref:ZIP family metal transporter n=1 Tax=Janthinobacterium sp. KBS0711 TaxID=1649647 RepID=UPI000637E7F8|nr:ZIP family metal transporter [Janthinobacterium sp. KBS0711]KKO65865.1 Zinc transporter ZupT [Janthinobacterium sp. KBS0711]